MIEKGKGEFEDDEVSLPVGGNVHAHVNNEDSGSHESKKPRKSYQHSHAKLKTGCNTCKARRVKCDETKPACMRCQKFGRVCDGYSAFNERWKPENQMTAVSASGMSASNEHYDTGTSPLANERDYRLEDTTPKLPSIKEQLLEDGAGRKSQMLSRENILSDRLPPSQVPFYIYNSIPVSSDSLSEMFGQSQPKSLVQFCDPTGPTSNETPSHTFLCQGSVSEGFHSQACSHLGCSEKINDPFQLTRHEKLHLRVGISGEEDCSTQFTVELATDESPRPRNLEYTILSKATADPLAPVDHDSVSAKALQNFNSSDNNGYQIEINGSASADSTTAGHPKCPYCDYEPGGGDQWKAGNLRRHIKEKHLIRLIDRLSCPLNECKATFTRSGNLKAHEEKCHGISHDVKKRRQRNTTEGGIESTKNWKIIAKEAVNIAAVDVIESEIEEMQAIQARSPESFESEKRHSKNHRAEGNLPPKDHSMHPLGHHYDQEAEMFSAHTWSYDDQIITEQLGRPGSSVFASDLEVPSNFENSFNDIDSSEVDINQHDLFHWDVKSLASVQTYRDSGLGSSLPSQESASITQDLPQAAKEEILTIIYTDSELRSSLSNIASKISKPRFIRNIRRLLQFFILELRKTVTDTREKDVVNILERHAPWFATRLFDFTNPNRDSDSRAMASYLDQQIDVKFLVEKYLALSVGTKLSDAQIIDEAEKRDTAAVEVDDSIDIDYSEFPNLEHIKRFISGGSAFEILRLNLLMCSRNELPDPSLGNTSVHIEPKSPSHLETNHISNFQRFRSILAKQGRIVLVIQRFLKLMRAHSIVHSYSAVDQATPDIFEIVSNSSDHNSPNETPETSPNTSITASGDIESDTNDTQYDSDDLLDDPELSASAEERITNPKAYFDRLESLEQQVFNNSGLFIHKTGDSTGPSQDAALLCLPESEYHKYETDCCLNIIKYYDSELLLDLLLCHNRAHRAGNNLTTLQDNGYCAKHISLLVQDQQRAGVVRVIQIEIQTILDLVGVFKELMGKILVNFTLGQSYNRFTAEELDRLIQEIDDSLNLTQECLDILSLTSILILPDMACRPSDGFVWQLTTQVIELAILSYAGAHIQPFDTELVEKDSPSFRIPQRFKYHDKALNRLGGLSCISTLGGSGVEMRRRQLQCMDRFLGGKQPWVFHPFSHGSPDYKIRLFLSSTIEALTDLWGPSWKIMRSSLTNEIKQYDIGNGAIIPWKTQNGDNDTNLVPMNSEVFCHWIPFKTWNEEEVDANQESLPRQYLLSSDILLIGAPNNYGLLVNEKCVQSPERALRIKSRLSDQQALRSPNTSRARRYVDSHAIQIQGSAMGFISGAGQVTYKRRIGHTMKDALVERWRHGLRNPLDLEAYSGVEVSLCSRNARRQRLLNILASDTMVNYLHAISFRWDNGVCESSYLKALRCPKSFRKFWKADKDWQTNIGDAISKCLDALEETGIDEDNQELSAFWVESFDAEGDSDGEDDDDSIGQPGSIKGNITGGGIQSPVQNNIAIGLPTPPNSLISLDLDTCNFFEEWIVTLFRSEHTWTGFLEDSEESLTMVVVGKQCLDFHDQDGFGRCCSLAAKTKGYPVLQTSLQINESLLSNCSAKLKQEKVVSSKKTIWNAHELKRGTTFCLGNHGTLEVISGSSKLCPTVVEWRGVKGGKSVGGILKEVKNVGINENLLGKSVEKHHKEFIRGYWEVKPLPVLVLSKSTKVRFGKD
ncbi:hypothetical protein BTUL_0131g00230 [Botrytis tulipae]|uniref:Zn(2)-C6 fungal-type domain-containing protein n=1 Tax=Botrytis tulipae TaxID=87230 RepID=A0A4Z1EIF0_9HELO|nr:hypothetical protein BTUL_0131g00230 [Botrytis tulipae]